MFNDWKSKGLSSSARKMALEKLFKQSGLQTTSLEIFLIKFANLRPVCLNPKLSGAYAVRIQ